MLIASSYPNKIATIAPNTNERITPKKREKTPAVPEDFKSLNLAPYAVATIAKSLSMDPPNIPTPDNTAISATPLSPPVTTPAKYANNRAMIIAIAEPWKRP